MTDRSTMGRRNRSRGNAFERETAKKHGGKRTGMFGGPDDVTVEDQFKIQTKVGKMFSEKFWRWLKAMKVNADQIAYLVIGDAPGPGTPRRVVVIIDERDWLVVKEKAYGSIEASEEGSGGSSDHSSVGTDVQRSARKFPKRVRKFQDRGVRSEGQRSSGSGRSASRRGSTKDRRGL
jgi:hypothetical protein